MAIFLEHRTGNFAFELLLLIMCEQIKILSLAQICACLADPLRLDAQSTKQGSRLAENTRKKGAGEKVV